MEAGEMILDAIRRFRRGIVGVRLGIEDGKYVTISAEFPNSMLYARGDFGKVRDIKNPVSWAVRRINMLRKSGSGEFAVCLNDIYLLPVLNKLYFGFGRYHVILYGLEKREVLGILGDTGDPVHRFCINFTTHKLSINDAVLEFKDYRILTTQEDDGIVPEEIADDLMREELEAGI